MMFYNILMWRNADCGSSFVEYQLIDGVKAWANAGSKICSSFGEKLSVCSFTSIVWVIFCISSNSKNRIFESKYFTILMSRWSLSMLFSLHLTSLYSLTIWTHPRCTFPKAAAAALSLGIGAVLGVGSPQVPTRFHSWARLYRWITRCPKPCPSYPICSFPLSLCDFSGQQLPVPVPPL